MSEKLTVFERALLAQFETLEAACGTALENTESVSESLRELGDSVKVRFDMLVKAQEGLEQRQSKLIAALDEQTRLTEAWKERSEALVKQVNTLLDELQN